MTLGFKIKMRTCRTCGIIFKKETPMKNLRSCDECKKKNIARGRINRINKRELRAYAKLKKLEGVLA